jgi:ABC-type sugar transport system substrate-binding protein
MAARYLVKRLGSKGSAIELEGSTGSSPAIERKKGFDEVIGASKVKILSSRDAGFSRSRGNQVMTELIGANPVFDAVVAANDDMIFGAIDAMSATGIEPSKKITIEWDASARGTPLSTRSRASRRVRPSRYRRAALSTSSPSY